LSDKGVLKRLLSPRKIAGVGEQLDVFRALRIEDPKLVSTGGEMENFDASAKSFAFEPPQHAAIIGTSRRNDNPQTLCRTSNLPGFLRDAVNSASAESAV